MPRQLRLELAGVPMHVTQRGVNRCASFLDDTDRHHYRRLLRAACHAYDVRVHAFVLMDNHVHLLLSSRVAGAVSKMMRGAGQAYVQAFNARHGRCGTLWQGRFKSCLVDSERYLLPVLRYIELNPVRAATVALPGDDRCRACIPQLMTRITGDCSRTETRSDGQPSHAVHVFQRHLKQPAVLKAPASLRQEGRYSSDSPDEGAVQCP